MAMFFSVWNLSNLDCKPDLKLFLTPSGDMAWAFLDFSFLVVITWPGLTSALEVERSAVRSTRSSGEENDLAENPWKVARVESVEEEEKLGPPGILFSFSSSSSSSSIK